jgi:hypothetical protein
MASIAPKNKEIVCHIPARVTFLGEALKPVAENLRKAMALKVKPSGQEFVLMEDLMLHMDIVVLALTHLSPRFDDLMTRVVKDESAGMAEAYRAAGRFEQVMSEFTDGLHAAQASHASAESNEARELMIGVYRHHIREITDWLFELVSAIARPLEALSKQGIQAGSSVTLPVILNLTSPPEMAKLHELSKELQTEFQETPPLQELAPDRPRPGLLGTIGALAFGLGVVNQVFGKHR